MPNASEALGHELVALEHELTEATKAHYRERLEQLVGREFTLVGPLGKLDREEWLDYASGPYEIDDFAYDEIDIELFGKTAVLASRYRQTARLGDRDLSGSYLVTDVWIRRNGGWQIVRRHATLDEH